MAKQWTRVSRWAGWGCLAVLVVWGLGDWQTKAIAAAFDQQEIDQSRFIAIAAPGGRVGYKLLILEQLNNQRLCWSETGSNPSVIDPLLLQFDFTGICGRSTDSNGYSLRLANQDLGLQYHLQILNQQNDLVLVAVSNRDPRSPAIEIGRTHGITDGFSRIVFNSGWRLTRRVYNGRPLGHLYLTNDQSLSDLVVAAAPAASSPSPANPAPDPASATRSASPLASLTAPVPIPVPPPESSVSSAANSPPTALPTVAVPIPVPPPESASVRSDSAPATVPTAPVRIPVPLVSTSPPLAASTQPAPVSTGTLASTAPIATASASDSWYQVIVQVNSAEQQDQVRAIAPTTLLTTLNDQVVLQAGVFRDRNSAEQLQQKLANAGLQAMVMPL